jgi:phage-related protein
VGLLQTLEDSILQKLKSFFAPVIEPVQKLFKTVKDFFTALIDVVPETVSLVTLVISEVKAWRSFRSGISFKSGVINLQSSRDRIEDLIQEILDAWRALLGLFTDGFKLPLKSINEAADAAEEAVVAFEDFFGKFGLEEFLQRLVPKLKKAGGKVFEVLALIEAVAEAALKVVRQLSTIVNAVADVRKTFQTGEGLFLQQKNKRRVETLEDGTKIKIRLGNLHQ